MLNKSFIFIVVLQKYSLAYDKSLRVIGGRNAEKDEFPFVARLDRVPVMSKDNHTFEVFERFCTGSILAPTWTVSAAHCFGWFDSLSTSFEIYVRYNNYFPEIKGEISKVLKIHTHPRYILNLRYMRYDIALGETENTIIPKYAKLSAVDYTTLYGHEVYGVGYGLTNVTGNPQPLQVLKGMLSKCNEKAGILAGVCLRAPCNIKASMTSGNSGGPLVHRTGIVAILSMGQLKYYPVLQQLFIPAKDAEGGIYTSISPVLDWLLTVMKRM